VPPCFAARSRRTMSRCLDLEPLDQQSSRHWLRPGGYLLAITGAQRWTGTERYLGANIFWDHADTASYLDWLTSARLTPIWHRHVPEGQSGHSLILARAS
jgi:hypothetical protein